MTESKSESIGNQNNHDTKLPCLPMYVPDQLTESQERVLNDVLRRLKRLGNANKRNNSGNQRQFLDNFLYIIGERGSGKTTLLYALMQRLQRQNNLPGVQQYVDTCLGRDGQNDRGKKDLPFSCIPLCPIDPEMFNGDEKFILAWVFLRIEEVIEKIKKYLPFLHEPAVSCQVEWNSGSRGKELFFELEEALSKVKKSLALIGGGFKEHVKNFSYTSTDFSNNILEVQQSGLRLVDYINYFLNKFFNFLDKNFLHRENHPALLLIPFDDIDLTGIKGAKLLQVLNTYLRHDRVVLLFLGAFSAFKKAIYGDLVSTVPDIVGQRALDDPYFYRVSKDILQKYMRAENIFPLYTYDEQVRSSDFQQSELASRLFYVPIYSSKGPLTSGSETRKGSSEASNGKEERFPINMPTDFVYLLRGNLRHQLAFYHWLHELGSVYEKNDSKNQEKKNEAEDAEIKPQKIMGILKQLIQLLKFNSEYPDFESRFEKTFDIDSVNKVITLDMVELSRLITRDRSGDNVLQDLNYMVRSVCFSSDILAILDKEGAFSPFNSNGQGIRIIRRSTPQSENSIILFFFNRFWSWLDAEDMPSMPSDVERDGRFYPWSTISVMVKLCRDKLDAIILNVGKGSEQSKDVTKENIQRIDSYLNSSSSQLSSDVLAKIMLRYAMVLAALDLVSGTNVKAEHLKIPTNFKENFFKKRFFDTNWQISLIELFHKIDSSSLEDSPLLPFKDKIKELAKDLINLFSVGEPKDDQLREFLEGMQRGEIDDKWLIWAYTRQFISFSKGKWYLTNEGEVKLKSLRYQRL